MKKNDPNEPTQKATFTAKGTARRACGCRCKSNYTEQLTWRDAATGRILAESDFFEPLTINSLTPPGYGGRVYFPTIQEFITLWVQPEDAASS